MAVINSPAIILRHTDDRERDRLVSVLTPTHGQLRLRARGTKRSMSKLAGSLEPVTEVSLSFAEGRTFGQITGAVLINRWPELRQDAQTLVAAQWLLELVERVSKPGTTDPKFFELVKQEISALGDESGWSMGQRWLALDRHAWRIMQHEGFIPALNHCPRCQKTLNGEAVVYDPGVGFVHPHEASPDRLVVGSKAIAFLQDGQKPDDARATFREVNALIESLIHQTLDRPLNSERVLRAVYRGVGLSSRER